MKLHHFAIKLNYLSLLLLLPFTFPCLGQSGNSLNTNSLNNPRKTDPASLINNQIDYIRNSYSEKIVAPKELINGKEYESYYNRSTSKPLLFPKKKRTAVLLTTSRKYTNLTLEYDSFLDEVIYTDTSRTFNYTFPKIALNNNIIDGFTLYFEDDSMNFKYLRTLQGPEAKP